MRQNHNKIICIKLVHLPYAYEWRVRNTIIEPDWLNMLVDRGENKVTSIELTKYDFAAAYLDTSYCCFYWQGCKHEEQL